MSRIKIEDLPINQDLSEAEAKGVKAGAVLSGIKSPTLSSFAVVKPPPLPLPSGFSFLGANTLNPIAPLVSDDWTVTTNNAVAGVRG